MAIPNHTISCITKAFKTNCPDCNHPVWFFSCSCGSKVYFDDLGYPWDLHRCVEYSLRKQIEIIHNVDRLSASEIYQIITKHEKKTGLQIDDSTLEVIERIIGLRKYDFKCNKVPPGEETEIGGKVMEINNPINIFKKLGYDHTPIAEKLLGEIGKETWLALKIRTKVDQKNTCLEFEVLMKRKQWLKQKISKFDSIAGIIKPLKHSKGAFWILIEYRVL